MKTLKNFFIIAVLLTFSAITASVTAQVTIGADNAPSSFSVLELISGGNKGLRLPQVETTSDRDAIKLLFVGHETEAMGLQIFNKETQCVETWNGADWIAQCVPPPPPIVVIPPGKGGDTWSNAKWVGAFWKDSQTGERIIASTNTPGIAWSASVDDPSGSGSWLTLAANGGTDPNLWTATPGDAENYQLPSTRVTTVSGTGNILFRIGVTGTDSRTTSSSYKYPDNSNGKAPRYATVTLTVNGVSSKIYCRQGEAADYVFTKSETYNDPNSTAGTNIPRSKAVMFSPYNLTDAALSESVTVHQTTAGKGVFTDFPTKAGAFFQWGMNANITYAYHPTQPTGAVSGWSQDYYSAGYWDAIKTAQETCPAGWHRPNDGITNAAQIPVVGTDATAYLTNNIYLSEIRQSLYAVPKNGFDRMTETTGRAWGYYADGFFDRRPIIASATGTANSAVSVTTKDAAYIGTLFFNAANGNRSLFMPAPGCREWDNGHLNVSGTNGFYLSTASSATNAGCALYSTSGYARQDNTNRNYGFQVRCVAQ